MERSKILIVDDNPLNIHMLEIILKNDNYQVLTALKGMEGLRIAAEDKPDLIFLDIMMPEIDGFEVCEKLKATPATHDIPVIFLTAKSDTAGIVKGFELGAADYVTRPFNRVELMARLKTHLALRSSRDRIVELERKNSILAMGTTTNHEINQPLTVLSGNLFLIRESLNKDEISADQSRALQKMDHAVMQIKGLLAKYQNPDSAHFETYSGKSKMIVFED